MKAFNKNLIENPLLEFLEKTYPNEGKIIYDALMDSPFLPEIQQGDFNESFIRWKVLLKVESNLGSLGSQILRFYKNEKI